MRRGWRTWRRSIDDKDVAFIGINSNQQDSITEVAAQAQRQSLTFPVLKDPANKIADRFGAVRTPEVFVLDADRVVRVLGPHRRSVRHRLSKAQGRAQRLGSRRSTKLLAGKPVSQPTDRGRRLLDRPRQAARPVGRRDLFESDRATAARTAASNAITKGRSRRSRLTNYDEVVGWAEMIREVVHERRMPPWLAAPEHGDFKNNPSLDQG